MIAALMIGLVVGVAVAAAVAAALNQRRSHAFGVSLATERGERLRSEEALAAAEARHREAEQRALLERGELKVSLARLEAELEAERRSSSDKQLALTQLRDDLVARFGKSAGEVLDARGRQLVDRLKSELATAKAESDADLAKRQKAVEEMVSPLKQTVTEIGQTIEKLDIDRRRSHTELMQGLRAATDAQKELRTETGALGRALRQPHTRGKWGEMHLRRLLEIAGLSETCDFTEQSRVEDDGALLRPDLVVHLPGDKDIVIDAKTPLAPYLDACEATDEAARAAHMKLYARGVRAHVKKLAAKSYAAQFPSAPDFVLMYIPGEHFFSAAVETDPRLIEDALGDGVLIATPTTLLVMLKTVAHAWQQERVADEAQAVATLGQELYDRLTVYLNHADRVSKCLNTVVEAQNKAVGSLEGRVLPTARRFPDLGAVAIDKQLPSPRQVNSTARSIQAPEQTARADDDPAPDTPVLDRSTKRNSRDAA